MNSVRFRRPLRRAANGGFHGRQLRIATALVPSHLALDPRQDSHRLILVCHLDPGQAQADMAVGEDVR